MRSLLFIAATLAAASALHFLPYRPGLIPDLSKQVSNLMGGFRLVDLTDERKLRDLQSLVDRSLIDLQKRNPVGHAHISMVQVEQAIEQLVRGTIYKVVFSAKQTNPAILHGLTKFGQCYFNMYVPLGGDENNRAEVTQHICVEDASNKEEKKKAYSEDDGDD